MPKRAHFVAGLVALLCIATFFLSTIGVELFGSPAAVARLKSLIVTPGLWILVPAIAATGGSGLFLGRTRRGRLVDAKKKNHWAAAGSFGAAFYAVQALELVAGAVNLTLMGLNMRDGLRLTGRRRAATRA